MDAKPRRRGPRILLISLAVILGLCLLCGAISAFSNRSLPDQAAPERLADLDKARLDEALNLRAELGDEVWPGWGSADIPVIIWNDAYEFLIGYGDQFPAGWSAVPDDSFSGEPYARRPAENPQNFAVRVGDKWAASMATKSTTDAFLISQFRGMFPPPLEQVFPYRLLIQPTETQIGGVLHESFHVFQLQTAPGRLQAAEAAHQTGDQYWSAAGEFKSEWREENELLVKALQAGTGEEKRELARQFLAVRDTRRTGHNLSAELVDFEKWLEWEEGTAKYVELAGLRAASENPNYRPLQAMAADPDFKAYRTFNRSWSQELAQMRYQTVQGEVRLYASGLAQAFLLDDLRPGWKEQYWQDGVFLEDLLRAATGGD